MKAELNEQYPIIEKLEYNFLINEDIYSFNTLMSLLYDKNFVKFSKNDYYVKDYVIKNLKKYFRNLSDIDQIAMTLENLVTDDLNIYNDKNLVSKLKENMGIYCDLKIKLKIYTLDQTTHKQLRFDTSSIYTEDITITQTKKIYEKSQSYLYKSIVDIYAEYYFRGLLREVLERYQ